MLNQLLGTQIAKSPSALTFHWLLMQLDVERFETLEQQWMAAQPGTTDTVETLVCDGPSGIRSIRPPPAQRVMASGRLHLHCQR